MAVKKIAVLIEDTEKMSSEKDVRPQHELKEELLVKSEGIEKETVEKIEELELKLRVLNAVMAPKTHPEIIFKIDVN